MGARTAVRGGRRPPGICWGEAVSWEGGPLQGRPIKWENKSGSGRAAAASTGAAQEAPACACAVTRLCRALTPELCRAHALMAAPSQVRLGRRRRSFCFSLGSLMLEARPHFSSCLITTQVMSHW